jgi:site-specific DNA-cytosine methylase
VTAFGLILSLCDHSGVWSRPYREAGYRVSCVDLQDGQDVRLMPHIDEPVHGILAAPPCDHFAVSGARWWEAKGEQPLLDGLAIVDACLRAVAIYRPEWWVLENPRGRLSRYLGPPAWSIPAISAILGRNEPTFGDILPLPSR